MFSSFKSALAYCTHVLTGRVEMAGAEIGGSLAIPGVTCAARGAESREQCLRIDPADPLPRGARNPHNSAAQWPYESWGECLHLFQS
jgi:hypothetical protein